MIYQRMLTAYLLTMLEEKIKNMFILLRKLKEHYALSVSTFILSTTTTTATKITANNVITFFLL